MLNNRDWASIIWLGVVAAYVLRDASVRSSVAAMLRTLVLPGVLLPLLTMVAYTTALVWTGSKHGRWTTDQLKDVILWFFATAVVLLVKVSTSAQHGFFRRAVFNVVKVTLFLEFFLNLFVFSLPIELVLVPILFLVATIPIVARKTQDQAAIRITTFLSAALGIGIAVHVAWKLATQWRGIANVQTVRSLAVPVWMTIGLLPFIYILSLWVNYRSTFALIDLATVDRRARFRTKAAIATTLHVETSAAGSFRWPWIGKAVDSTSFHEARQVVKKYREHRKADVDETTSDS